MQITYEDNSVRELFEDLCQIQVPKGLMKKLIGSELTRAVKKRYDHLKAADNFYIFQMTGLGKTHSLTGMEGCYGVHVTANWRLVIKPIVRDTSPESLKNCDTVQIKGVVDYHGKGAKNNWIIP